MNYLGALKQLEDFKTAEDIPTHYKPAIADIINVMLFDTQELKHGHWIPVKLLDDEADFGEVDGAECSVCGGTFDSAYWAKTYFRFCPYCGNPLDEVER